MKTTIMSKFDRAQRAASRTYYTLLTRDNATAPWQIAFGDYSRKVVELEWDDMVRRPERRRNLRIIATGETQADIDAAVLKLNVGQ
jgi:hypothetical protein